MKNRNKFCFSFFIIILILLGTFSLKIEPLQAGVALENAQADKAKLEAELVQLDIEKARLEKQLNSQKGQSTSISRDIAILTTQINKSKLDIKAKNLIIQKLGGEISQKNQQIKILNSKIENQKDSLSQLIRKEREIENKSIVVLILSQETISDAYKDIGSFASIKNSIKKSVGEIKTTKNLTEVQKKDLEIKKDLETDNKVELENAKAKVELNEDEKKKLLNISKQKESEYQKVLAEKARRRSQILSALFKLRDNSAIPFSKALEYANFASEKTGVRAAFLLAISTQESGDDPNAPIGVNLGSCYLKDKITGEGIGIKSGNIIQRVMKSPRDTEPFIELMANLGRDPYQTPVSCPWSTGYGGAMGPLQFITSTWDMVKGKTADYLGIKTADPWNGQDAFMAAAVLLKGNGAISGSYTAERDAACRYYSGRPCSAPNVKNAFYGNAVMAKAQIIQNNIDLLQS